MAEERKPTTSALLSPEDLSTQLDTLQVVLSLYGSGGDDDEEGIDISSEEGEGTEENGSLILPASSAKAIENLARFLALPVASLGDNESVTIRDALPAAITLALILDPLRGSLVEEDDDSKAQGKRRTVRLDVGIPLRRKPSSSSSDSEKATQPMISISQTDWMSRSDHADLVSFVRSYPYDEEDGGSSYILSLAEDLCERALPLLLPSSDKTPNDASADETTKANETSDGKGVTRSWHSLVSLSVPSKRADLLSYAKEAGLTGFVLAGKPGLVVLESVTGEGGIDAYWREIRSRSWSDLPPASKKVTQRLVERDEKPIFTSMQDISEELQPGMPVLGAGGRVRHTDLGALRRWLDTQSPGLSSRLDTVL